MTEQPMPHQSGGDPVTPAARGLFLAMLAEREAKGIATYGRTLHTHNGRDALHDLAEELVDAWQYLVQERIGRAEIHAALARWLKAKDDYAAMLEYGNAELDSADLVAATAALERVARRVVAAAPAPAERGFTASWP